MSRKEIDAAIARHAESEVLVDQPLEDKKRVRVTGRFTVESLSPHRSLDEHREEPKSSRDASADASTPDFTQTILDNLRKAGVTNTVKGENLRFERLDPFAGRYLQGEGEWVDADGDARRVAIAIGPEHGTVSNDLVKEAAKEAVRGMNFDLLVVCGFAFDAYTGETAREFKPSGDGFAIAADERKFGRLPIQMARMNPDLAMGGDLLKKTGAANNLFMIFGEPDVDITKTDDEMTVSIRGVDVYDPTTGVVRASSTDEIACWFIDSNYNGESFFVRHAYFTGGNKPYESLSKALKAEIEPEAWNTLYSTVSRSFPTPDTGRIAVKVINHYGDEVLKVYDV